jgi:hypothetical protein
MIKEEIKMSRSKKKKGKKKSLPNSSPKKSSSPPKVQPKSPSPKAKTLQANSQSTNISVPKMRLDSREFSREAHTALVELKEELSPAYYKKASGLVQGLSTYISTWGLHRLSGDMNKFLEGRAEDTTYKGRVYRQFLQRLSTYSGQNFNVNNEGSLIHLPLRTYTSLNRLAIQLAKEWSFWAVAVLGEAEES